jgi:hypothetical protein
MKLVLVADKDTGINSNGGGPDIEDEKSTTASHFPWKTRAA